MGFIELNNKSIFLDTAPLIYYIEDDNSYSKVLDMIFEQNVNKKVHLTTSTITLLEVLVRPLKTNNFDLAEKYKTLLCQSDAFEVCNLDVEIAGKAAEVRAKYQLKTPDAIQVATAICCFSDYFLTNDKQLKIVSELNVLVLDEIIDL